MELKVNPQESELEKYKEQISSYYRKLLYCLEAIRESFQVEETIQGETINCNLLLNNTNLFYTIVRKLIALLDELENYVENKLNYKHIHSFFQGKDAMMAELQQKINDLQTMVHQTIVF